MFIVIIILTGCHDSTANKTQSTTELHTNEKTAEYNNDTNPTIYYDYNISLEITDFESKKFTGFQSVNFVNTSKIPIDRINFNIPLNCLNKDTNKAISRYNEYKYIFYGSDVDYGHLDIINPKVDNEAVEYLITGTTLELLLPEKLQPGQNAQIAFNFEGRIPGIKYYFGANDNIVWVSNMLPELAILNDRGWNTDISYLVGDPRFTNCSNYTVLVTVPEYCTVIGHNLEATSSDGEGDKKTVTYKNNNTRNFSFAFYEDENITQTKYSYSKELDVNFHFYSDAAEKRTEEIKDAVFRILDFCNTNIGRYPYKTIDFIEIDYFRVGGFSASQTIFLDSTSISTMSDTTIATLVAKQWFSSIIGSDNIKSPWISEGLSSLIAEIAVNENIYNSLEREFLELGKFMSEIENNSMLLDLSAYRDNYEYTKIQNVRSKLMFFALKQQMGESKFFEFLKSLFVQYSFNIVDKNSFIELASKVYGAPLDSFFDDWQVSYVLPHLFESYESYGSSDDT